MVWTRGDDFAPVLRPRLCLRTECLDAFLCPGELLFVLVNKIYWTASARPHECQSGTLRATTKDGDGFPRFVHGVPQSNVADSFTEVDAHDKHNDLGRFVGVREVKVGRVQAKLRASEAKLTSTNPTVLRCA